MVVQQGEQTRLAGFCTAEGAAERTLLTLPGEFGPHGRGGEGPELLTQPVSVQAGEGEAGVEPGAVQPLPFTLEQLHALAWSLRYGAGVALGPCDRLKDAVPAALALDAQPEDGGMRILVDLAGAGNPDVGAANVASINLAGAVELASIQGPLEAGSWAGPGSFALAEPVANDWACPGNYVMGQVLDRDGAPLAGVRIVMRDPWGNQTETRSKGGPNDYGQFDFPIWGDGAQDLTLTVVDEGGNSLSAPVAVPHKRDAASDTPCHHVVLRGG